MRTTARMNMVAIHKGDPAAEEPLGRYAWLACRSLPVEQGSLRTPRCTVRQDLPLGLQPVGSPSAWARCRSWIQKVRLLAGMA